MKSILAAAVLAVTGAQADAAVFSFKFVVTSGSTENIDLGTGMFSIEADSLANLSIMQNSSNEGEDFDLSFLPPILSTPFGMQSADPSGLYFEVLFDASGELSSLFIGSSELQYWNFYTQNYVQAGYDPGDGTFFENVAYGYWKELVLSPVPLPATGPMLLAGASLLFGLRRRAKA